MKDRLQSLLDREGASLFRLLTRLTLRQDVAADLLQQLFADLAASDGFRRATDPSAYAGRCAINLAFQWRRRQVRRHAETSLDVDLPGPLDEPLHRLIDAEQVDAILRTMQDLSDQTREAMVLRFIEDLSYDECAQRMNKNAQQVRGLCHAGVRQLRERFAHEENREPLKQVRHE